MEEPASFFTPSLDQVLYETGEERLFLLGHLEDVEIISSKADSILC